MGVKNGMLKIMKLGVRIKIIKVYYNKFEDRGRFLWGIKIFFNRIWKKNRIKKENVVFRGKDIGN